MKQLILNTIKIPLNPIQRAHLNRIDQEDLVSVIKIAEKEIMEKRRTPLHPDQAVYGLRQYYALAALNPNNMHAISRSIDPYWHAHILHTAKYDRFCVESVGYFMHHDPLDPEDERKARHVHSVYTYTLEVLQHLFGDNVDPACYPADVTTAEMICWHFNKVTVDHNALFRPDPRFEDIRREFSIAA